MSLRDEVAAVPNKKRAYVDRCLTEQGESPEEFAELLADPSVEPMSIYHMLIRRNIDVSHGSVYAWCGKARRDSA